MSARTGSLQGFSSAGWRLALVPRYVTPDRRLERVSHEQGWLTDLGLALSVADALARPAGYVALHVAGATLRP